MQRQYYYSVIDRVKASIAGSPSDPAVAGFIESASKRIVDFSGVLYTPRAITSTFYGNGGKRMRLDERVLVANSLSDSEEVFDKDPNGDWRIDKDLWHLISQFSLSERAQFSLAGVFGWVEDYKSISTTLAAELTGVSQTTTTLVSTDDIYENDVAVMTNADGDELHIIITEVNTTTKVITFDIIDVRGTYAIGDSITVYGRYPEGLMRLIDLTTLHLSKSYSQQGLNTDRVKTERLKDQAYTFEKSAGGYGYMKTGSSEGDMLLAQYSKPFFMEAV